MAASYPCRHQGHYSCHWCWEKGKFQVGINRMVFAGYKRMLPPDDPGRGANTPEAPAARTHEETCQLGKEADTYDKSGLPGSGHPKHDTGINRWCPLAILKLFCLIRDICPDMMHIIKGLLGGHWIPLLKGERPIARPVCRTPEPKRKTGQSNEEWGRVTAGYRRKKKKYRAHCKVSFTTEYKRDSCRNMLA